MAVRACRQGLGGFLSRVLSIAILFYLQSSHKINQITFLFLRSGFSSPRRRAQDKKVYIIMANRQKNNFNDRLKRLGCEELQRQTRGRNRERGLHFESLREIPAREESQGQKITIEMFDFMKKQMDMLTVKLQQAEKDRQKMGEEMTMLAIKIGEKDVESTYLSRQLQQSHRSIDLFKKKLDAAQSELQNLRLRQKMEAISKELIKQQPPGTSLKHQKHRKGKFSSAVLPPAFGSQKKFEFHSAEMVREEEEIDNRQSILRSPFSGYLIEEWQRTHNERNNKELEVANLESKVVGLKKEIARQNKEIQQLKGEKPSGQELAAAMEAIRQHERREKLVLMKLRESEKKRKELTNILKEKGQSVEEDKFYGFSTIADINDMIEKNAQNLEIESNVFQIWVDKVDKVEQSSQTEEFQQINESPYPAERISQEWSIKLKEKQQYFSSSYNELKEHYEDEIHQYISQLESQKSRIKQYENALQLIEGRDIMSCSIAVECHLMEEKQFGAHEDILEKVKILMEVNEEFQQRIAILQSHNQQLNKRLDSHKKKVQVDQQAVQVDQQYFLQEEQQQSDCPSCKELKHAVYISKDQIIRLNKIIETVNAQGRHFEHCYEEALATVKELQAQISKLRVDYQQKEKSSLMIQAEIEQLSNELQRYKAQIMDLQDKIREYQHSSEVHSL